MSLKGTESKVNSLRLTARRGGPTVEKSRLREPSMSKPWHIFLLVACTCLAARADDGFERHVRPLLAEHCHRCHGPQKQQGGLRLDIREGALKGGENGPVIVPAKPAESRLIAVLKPDAEPRMPPGKPLKAEEIATLESWIARGAPWPADKSTSHTAIGDPWGLKPLAAHPVPGDATRAIDAFITARLKREGLKPASRADRRVLLRRAAFVINGLPPSPEAVEAFVADTRPDAWEKAIDQLFTGNTHGERWARHWLDVARYADTKGYVFFQDGSFPWSWAYRDWVVKAFATDMPYDLFIRAQLAADRLQGTECGPGDLPALGFLTLGGRFMNNQHDIIDDRIDVVTRGLLALTVGCARCHDHKFDPVPTRDYYSLYSVFASSVEPEVPPLFAPEPATDEYACFREELAMRERELADFAAERHAKVLDAARARLADHLVAVARLRGKPPQDEFMLLADPDDPNPTLLKRWRAWLDAPVRRTDPIWRFWLRIEALGQDRFPSEMNSLLQAPETIGVAGVIVEALKSRKPTTLSEAAAAYASAFAAPNRARDVAVARSWNDPASPWNIQASAFSDLELYPDRAGQAVLQKLRAAVEQWRVGGHGAPPRAHALVDAAEPVQGRVFTRGNPVRPGEPVPRVVPASLGKGAAVHSGSGRLELARAITSPDHPLLARVWVNRVWQICFGEGLSRTPGDFGSRGDLPSHPELLDHLAIQLAENGWSTRRLIRDMLSSDAWQRSADATVEDRSKDPDHRFWAWREARRLDFEALRDSMLAVSGRLDPALGGPSTRDLNTTRRALYLHIDRLRVPGVFRLFDFPSPDTSSPMRDSTTTPLQALWLMNHPVGVSCAEALARRAGNPDKPDEWIARLYQLALQRQPTVDETGLLLAFLKAAGPDGPRQAAQAMLAGNAFSFVD